MNTILLENKITLTLHRSDNRSIHIIIMLFKVCVYFTLGMVLIICTFLHIIPIYKYDIKGELFYNYNL